MAHPIPSELFVSFTVYKNSIIFKKPYINFLGGSKSGLKIELFQLLHV